MDGVTGIHELGQFHGPKLWLIGLVEGKIYGFITMKIMGSSNFSREPIQWMTDTCNYIKLGIIIAPTIGHLTILYLWFGPKYQLYASN
jgi:hypothetical protein